MNEIENCDDNLQRLVSCLLNDKLPARSIIEDDCSFEQLVSHERLTEIDSSLDQMIIDVKPTEDDISDIEDILMQFFDTKGTLKKMGNSIEYVQKMVETLRKFHTNNIKELANSIFELRKDADIDALVRRIRDREDRIQSLQLEIDLTKEYLREGAQTRSKLRSIQEVKSSSFSILISRSFSLI